MHCGLHIFSKGYALQQARGRPPAWNTCYDSYSVGEGIGDCLVNKFKNILCSVLSKQRDNVLNLFGSLLQ